jgi:RNA methyltransferase, TrmH family
LISNNEIKLITSLQQKKYRIKHGLFVAEGEKLIRDLIGSGMKMHSFFATQVVAEFKVSPILISQNDLRKISSLKNSNGWLAVFEIPQSAAVEQHDLILALDAVRDPGNLGTIIRLCDWFGISYLICSEDTVDCFNPKVVQATMGSIARVGIQYLSLESFLKESSLPIYGAVLNGANLYDLPLPDAAILVMGSEAHGISENISNYITHKITIPQFGTGGKAESLNVATATAILLSEFRRTIER